MDRRTVLGLAMAFVAYTAWGLLAPVAKILLETFPPLTLNAYRMALATLFLLPLVPLRLWREGFTYLRKPEVVVLAAVGTGIGFLLYIYALLYVDATFAVLGFYTAPLWTGLLARWRLGEKLGGAFVPALLLLGVGAWLALFGGKAPHGGFHAFGMLLAVGSGVAWAAYAVGLRVVAPGLRLRSLMVASFLVGTAFFVVAALLFEGLPSPPSEVPRATWGWLLLHAAVPTTLALWLFNASLQRAPASGVNILIAMELAATAFFSWLLLGDRFDTRQIIGLAIAIVAVSGYLWTRRVKAPVAGA